MSDVPMHPAITTRRAFNDRRQRVEFEPVAVPGDTRRYRPLKAVMPSLIGLGLFFYVVALGVAYVWGWNS